MEGPMGAAEFWATPSLVDAYAARGTALDYEMDAIERAVELAGRSGAVSTVHVLGVGAGRELPAVRAATGAARIFAWDLSPTMVDACRQRVTDTGLDDVVVGVADVGDLSRVAATASADVVIALGAVMGYLIDHDARQGGFDGVSRIARRGAGVAFVVQQRCGRPDWAGWFMVQQLLDAVRREPKGRGNRTSYHDSDSVVFHHYTRRELRQLMSAYRDTTIRSLRQWGRRNERRIPLRSPNPLIVTATVDTLG